MVQSVDTTHVRSVNLLTILHLIYQNETISKAELARILHMSKPSVADNVNDLLQLGIVQEIGRGECGSGGGRKPVLLAFRDDFKYIVTINFCLDYTTFVLTDLKGNILSENSIPETPMSGFDFWLTLCQREITTLLQAINITVNDVAAIGVSAPGILNPRENTYIIDSKYGNFDIDAIKTRLFETLPVPILFKNSTNASALGELFYGAGINSDSLAYVSCGQGLGAGIVIDRHLVEGSHFAAGEIGTNITPETINKPKPSLEERICIDGILAQINSTDDYRKRPLTFSDMITLWQEGEPYISDIVDQLAIELGCAITNLVSVVDCDQVIIGGEYLVFQSQLIPKINNIVSTYCNIPVPVVASKLFGKNSILGMIAACRESYFEQVCARS